MIWITAVEIGQFIMIPFRIHEDIILNISITDIVFDGYLGNGIISHSQSENLKLFLTIPDINDKNKFPYQEGIPLYIF